MKFRLSEEYAAEARELSAFGIEADGGGIPVEVKEGDDFARMEGGVLIISASKRVRVFSMLFRAAAKKTLPKEGELFLGKAEFSDLTYMIDCSRNAVPKKETLKLLVRHLAVLGYDSLGLYMEDTFVVPEYPYFGYLRNPYTKADLQELDADCKRFGIELVPYIQTLAHFNTLTRHYAMGHLFDVNDILLVGEEETYRFINALISTCAETFSTRSIHIGMDEAYMLGRGAYMDRNGPRDRFEIMSEHLTAVNEICKKYGLRPMMWSDMFFSLTMNAQYGEGIPPSVAEKIPADVELIYWDYCSSDKAHYAEMLQKHTVFKNRIGFAGAAWKWLGYTPDNRYSFACIEASGRACIDAKIGRYIVTGWGDNGGECSPFSTLPALLYAARVRYGDFSRGEEFEREFEALSGTELRSFLTLDLCNRVTDSDDVEERNSANKYLLFNDPLLGTLDTIIETGQNERYARHEKALSAAKEGAGRWAYLFETQEALAAVLKNKTELGIRLRSAYKRGDRAALSALSELTEKEILPAVERLHRAISAQWGAENRANGLDVQDIRLGALKERLRVTVQKIKAFLKEGKEIPELNEELLCFMGHGKDFEKDFDQCEWRWRRMTSVNVNE